MYQLLVKVLKYLLKNKIKSIFIQVILNLFEYFITARINLFGFDFLFIILQQLSDFIFYFLFQKYDDLTVRKRHYNRLTALFYPPIIYHFLELKKIIYYTVN